MLSTSRRLVLAFLTAIGLHSVPAQAGWVVYNGHSYGLTSSRLDWTDAEAQAVSLGGHLVAINDAAEQQFLMDTFLNGSRTDISQVLWIGLDDIGHKGTYAWTDGDPLTFTYWNTPTGEPNNSPPGEDYVAMNWQWVNGESSAIYGSWNDLPVNGQSYGPPGPYYGIIELSYAVPEPSGLILAGTGVVWGAMGYRTRRTKRRQV